MFRRSLVRHLGLLLATAALPLAASAHGPTRQKVIETVTIEAPAEAVWARIKHFAALKDWHPAVASSDATQADTVGSVRTVKIKGGGEITETLEGFDDTQMKYNYRAKADGAKCQVEWRGAFYRGYPNNDPPPDQNDEAAVAAVTGVYQAGLANLKKLAEAK
jgi:hypothetical protein